MKRNALHSWLVLPFLVGASCAPALADSVDFTLLQPMKTVSAGDTLSFAANVSAPASNTSPIYLNGDSFDITAPLVLDDSSFFGNFPLYLSPGNSSTEVLFTVQVPLNTSIGDYTGAFDLLGGSDESAENILGSAPFTVDVTSGTPPAITPEPSSGLLCASGLLVVGTMLSRSGRAHQRLRRYPCGN